MYMSENLLRVYTCEIIKESICEICLTNGGKRSLGQAGDFQSLPRKRASTEKPGGSQAKRPTHVPPMEYSCRNSHNWDVNLQWFGPSCVTHDDHILIVGKKPDQQTWRVYVYDIEGQWINVWVPRISFVPAGIEEVNVAGNWRIALSWGSTFEIDLHDPYTGELRNTIKYNFGPGRMNGKTSLGLIVRNCGPYQNGMKGVMVLDTSTEKLKATQLQVQIPKNVPYFTALDFEEDGLCKQVFLYSSTASLEVVCVTHGGGLPYWKQNKGEPFYSNQKPYILCASKQGHIFTIQAKEKEINVFNVRNRHIGIIMLPDIHTIHDAHVMDEGNTHRLVLLHKEKAFHSEILRVSVVTAT